MFLPGLLAQRFGLFKVKIKAKCKLLIDTVLISMFIRWRKKMRKKSKQWITEICSSVYNFGNKSL